MSIGQSNGSLNQPDWGNEVMPGVFFRRGTGHSAADAARDSGLGILSNTLNHDGTMIDYRKVHSRIKDRARLQKKLEDSNAYMNKYLRRERRRRERALSRQFPKETLSESLKLKEKTEISLAEEEGTKYNRNNSDKKTSQPAESEDEADLPPITPEEDDKVIEESILENEFLIKECKEELSILKELVAMQKCLQSGNANTTLPSADIEGHGSDLSDEEENEEGEENEEWPSDDDNEPFTEDVTGMESMVPSGRFAL